ncbi:membrane protein [Pseudomonas fluorescens HK44]|uniref:Membrane protein n=1 Tax=Pseudomonas fluorescens HK44 TaxID=1042209 RepID=A0A010TBN8_PSEFL|nr:OmpA family protein [Pseudomonas fluorescens]EXF94687.1 membrane protein [Pseudomonas fluorescens HK44]
MSPNKSLALALCLSITGCAQTPQNDADGGHWWSFGSGSDKVADKAAAKPDAKAAEAAAAAKAKSTASATAPAVPTTAAAAAAKADSESKWWWPFGDQPKAITKADIKDVPMPDPKITQAWLDSYEPRLRAAVQGSRLQVERRENVLVVVVPVDDAFNPKRPAMLLPSALGEFTKVSKVVEGDSKTSVLVLGHGDNTGTSAEAQQLSKDRATSIASIFSLSGLKGDRLMLRGMGSMMPRAANDSAQGRALNRRVEIMLTQRTTMLALLNKYSQPTPPPVEMVAVQTAKPAAPAVAAKKATSKKKGAASKKASAKKAPAKKQPAKKPAAAKADTAVKNTSGQ